MHRCTIIQYSKPSSDYNFFLIVIIIILSLNCNSLSQFKGIRMIKMNILVLVILYYNNV